MSGFSVPPAKPSLRERLRQPFRPRSRASSPSLASFSTQAFTSSTAQSPASSSTQILAQSSTPSTGLVAANSPNPSAATLSQQTTSNHSSSHNLLDDALKRLSDRDRATLQDHILPNSSDIDLALKQALDAAKERQRYCTEKRWTFTFNGRSFILKEEANKVVRWLNRFKDVGDIAASVDPVHAGLP
jgi:hypothetical protein